MSTDGITRINFLRKLYESKESGNSSDVVRELQRVKNELKIANDEKSRENAQITNATNSPYLPDQIFYKKDVVYNTDAETSWREVKTAEAVEKNVQEAYLESNRRKLNII